MGTGIWTGSRSKIASQFLGRIAPGSAPQPETTVSSPAAFISSMSW
jgi:hypothetical protein